jgi:hypothetical protein
MYKNNDTAHALYEHFHCSPLKQQVGSEKKLEKGVKVSNLGVQKIFTFDFTIQRLTI